MEFHDPDHELIKAIAQEDTIAYRTLITRHAGRCIRVAERMLGNRQDAEDVMQEVCLKIWNEAKNWQPRAKFSTWLYRVLINNCIDYQRKVIPFAEFTMDSLIDEQETADHSLIGAENSARVKKALELLDERQRAAVILSYYEEMNNKDAAEMLGLQLNAFQQLLYRARQNLKMSLLQSELEHKNG